MSYELRNRLHSPKSLCGSVLEHRSSHPKVWGSIPHGDSEFFLCPTFVTRRKNIFLTFFIFWQRQVSVILLFSINSILSRNTCNNRIDPRDWNNTKKFESWTRIYSSKNRMVNSVFLKQTCSCIIHVGIDILLMTFEDVLTSTLQSKSISFGNETVKNTKKNTVSQSNTGRGEGERPSNQT